MTQSFQATFFNQMFRALKEVWAPQCASDSAHQHATVSTNQIARQIASLRHAITFFIFYFPSCIPRTVSNVNNEHDVACIITLLFWRITCSGHVTLHNAWWMFYMERVLGVNVERRGPWERRFSPKKISNARKLTPWAPIFFCSNDCNFFFTLYAVFKKILMV